jgi:hypothetical protein
MATTQAGIHTPSWKERKRFPIFIREVVACFLVSASGYVDASGDASIVNVRHLIRLHGVVEAFSWLRSWLLTRVDLTRHAGKCPRGKSGVVDEELDPRATGREVLSSPMCEDQEAMK